MLILGGLRDVNVIFTRNIRSHSQRCRRLRKGREGNSKIGVDRGCSDRLKAEIKGAMSIGVEGLPPVSLVLGEERLRLGRSIGGRSFC